jgi:hypothetical protein
MGGKAKCGLLPFILQEGDAVYHCIKNKQAQFKLAAPMDICEMITCFSRNVARILATNAQGRRTVPELLMCQVEQHNKRDSLPDSVLHWPHPTTMRGCVLVPDPLVQTSPAVAASLIWRHDAVCSQWMLLQLFVIPGTRDVK